MSSKAPKPHSRGDATRDQILDGAWELIAEHGADVSMAQIAKHTGLSRQAVYLHFGTRGGLLVALVRRADERLDIRAEFLSCSAIESPRLRLDAVLEVWFRFVPRIYPVARDLIRLRSTDAEANAAWEDRMRDLRSWFRDLVLGLSRDGALAAHWKPRDASDYLWSACSVQAWGLLVEDCGWGAAKASRTLRRTICDALLGPVQSETG